MRQGFGLSHYQAIHWIHSRGYQLVITTIRIWSETNVSRNSAALTYYAMLSLAPLLLICIAVAGLFFCNQQVEQEIYDYFHDLASPRVAQTIAGLLANTTSAQNTLFASLISLAIMLYGASGIFTQFFDTFNDIWKVPTGHRSGIRFTARKRFLGVCMVLLAGVLLIGSLALGTVIAFLSQLLDGNFPRLASWLGLIDRALSFLLLPLVLSLMFWYLPMKKIRWLDVVPAAGLTAVLLTGSRSLIDFYLQLSTASEVYGAAGSLVLLLVWIYLTGQVIFFGACFSCAWAEHLGAEMGLVDKPVCSEAARQISFHSLRSALAVVPVAVTEKTARNESGRFEGSRFEGTVNPQQPIETAERQPDSPRETAAIRPGSVEVAESGTHDPAPSESPAVQLIRRPKTLYRRAA